jgi:hypothetical protein
MLCLFFPRQSTRKLYQAFFALYQVDVDDFSVLENYDFPKNDQEQASNLDENLRVVGGVIYELQ